MNTTPTDIARARELAHLFGGNGLSTEQQIEMVSVKLAQYREHDSRKPSSFADLRDAVMEEQEEERMNMEVDTRPKNEAID